VDISKARARAGARPLAVARRAPSRLADKAPAAFPPKNKPTHAQLRTPQCTRHDGAVVCHYASLALRVHDGPVAELTVSVGDFVQMLLDVRARAASAITPAPVATPSHILTSAHASPHASAVQDETRAVMLVDELFALQPAATAGACARPAALACVRGRWMWSLHDTPAGGFLSADDKRGKRGAARTLPLGAAAAPRRLFASDAAQTCAAHTAERVVRVRLLYGGEDLRCSGGAGASMEAAALAPHAPGEPPYDFWCDKSYDQDSYYRCETLQRSWPHGAPADAHAGVPRAADEEDEPPPGFFRKPKHDQTLRVFGARATSRLMATCARVSRSPPAVLSHTRPLFFLFRVRADAFCGAGGFSIGMARSRLASRPDARLLTTHALDSDAHACAAFALNEPGAQVLHMEMDVCNCLIAMFATMRAQVAAGDAFAPAVPTAAVEEEGLSYEVVDILDHGAFERGVTMDFGPVTHRQLPPRPDGAPPPALRAYVLVAWAQPPGGAERYEDSWVRVEDLSCPQLVHAYLQKSAKRRKPHDLVPRAGDIDLLVGGPPCQGVSGNNRRRSASATGDANTRQTDEWVTCLLLLRARFGIMENVCDLLKYVDGLHASRAIQRILEAGYQCMVTAVPAGAHGLPQTRVRVFIVVAAPGETLPPAPLPTHACHADARHVLPDALARRVLAVFPVGDARAAALQRPATLEDAIGDLPEVENDEEREFQPRRLAARAREALTPLQRALWRKRFRGRKASTRVKDHAPAAFLTPLVLSRLACVAKSRDGGAHGNYRDILAFVAAHPDAALVLLDEATGATHPLVPAHFLVRARARALCCWCCQPQDPHARARTARVADAVQRQSAGLASARVWCAHDRIAPSFMLRCPFVCSAGQAQEDAQLLLPPPLRGRLLPHRHHRHLGAHLLLPRHAGALLHHSRARLHPGFPALGAPPGHRRAKGAPGGQRRGAARGVRAGRVPAGRGARARPAGRGDGGADVVPQPKPRGRRCRAGRRAGAAAAAAGGGRRGGAARGSGARAVAVRAAVRGAARGQPGGHAQHHHRRCCARDVSWCELRVRCVLCSTRARV
jgi:site-specific DNA-cytosine methylase